MPRGDAAGWLIEHCPLQPAHGHLPATLPREFIVVRRVGGPRTNLVSDRPMLTIEVYASTKTRAYQLIDQVSDWLAGLSGRHPDAIVYSVREVGGPGDLPDPDAPKHTRCTFTVEMHWRVRRTREDTT